MMLMAPGDAQLSEVCVGSLDQSISNLTFLKVSWPRRYISKKLLLLLWHSEMLHSVDGCKLQRPALGLTHIQRF